MKAFGKKSINLGELGAMTTGTLSQLMQVIQASAEFKLGAVRKVVGIRGATSSNLKLSDQAARSIG
jgi:hypothetical protein